MSWFYLALLAPFLFAVVNLIDDNMLRFVYKGPHLATALTGLFGALPLVSLLFLDTKPTPSNLLVLMVLAGFLTTIYYFFYFRSLELESPSIVISMLSLVPATVPILSYFFLDERLTSIQIVGFLLVLLASLGLALTEVKKFTFSKALIPVLVVVLILDIVSILTKYVYSQADFYTAYMYFAAGMGLGGIYFPLIMYYEKTEHDFSVLKTKLHKTIPLLIFVELLGILSEFILNLAISRGPVSLVKAIEGSQPLFVLAIALILYPFYPKFFREAEESKSLKKFILMGIVVAGLAIISITSKSA